MIIIGLDVVPKTYCDELHRNIQFTPLKIHMSPYQQQQLFYTTYTTLDIANTNYCIPYMNKLIKSKDNYYSGPQDSIESINRVTLLVHSSVTQSDDMMTGELENQKPSEDKSIESSFSGDEVTSLPQTTNISIPINNGDIIPRASLMCEPYIGYRVNASHLNSSSKSSNINNNSEEFYCLVMLNLDFNHSNSGVKSNTSVTSPEYIYWMIVNLSSSYSSGSEVILPYKYPEPLSNTSIYQRHVIVLYNQSRRLNLNELISCLPPGISGSSQRLNQECKCIFSIANAVR